MESDLSPDQTDQGTEPHEKSGRRLGDDLDPAKGLEGGSVSGGVCERDGAGGVEDVEGDRINPYIGAKAARHVRANFEGVFGGGISSKLPLGDPDAAAADFGGLAGEKIGGGEFGNAIAEYEGQELPVQRGISEYGDENGAGAGAAGVERGEADVEIEGFAGEAGVDIPAAAALAIAAGIFLEKK